MPANYSIDFRGSSSEFKLAGGWPLVTGCWSLVTGRLSLGDGNQWYKVEGVRNSEVGMRNAEKKEKAWGV